MMVMEREDLPQRTVLVEWLKDLELFASLCMARIIVWRALRREQKQKSGRKQ